MECYNCGAELTKDIFCPSCGADVRVYKRIIQTSNLYYNEGLSRASVRDLTGAAESLRISLRYNKQNIKARNLLGLIYFEMGETVSALGEWVVSRNFQSEHNVANDYLSEVQKNPARLDAINLTIKKYNQALLYCKQNSCDLAVIQLKKVLSLNPKLVKAHQLLALLYIQDGKYDLAKKELRAAGKIDSNNLTTLRYLKEANRKLHAETTGKKDKKDDPVSYKSGNDMIIQPLNLKDTTTSSTIINIVIGIVIGILITCFLVVPSVRQGAKSDINSELVNANDTISTKNQTISSLQSQVDDLNSQLEEQQSASTETEDKITSYQQFLDAYISFTNGDAEAAGTAIANVNPDYLDETAKGIYDSINEQISTAYLQSIYAEGTKAYNSGDYETAVTDLQKVVDQDETYQAGDAVYFLAQSYRKNGDNENAKIYYQKMIEAYPNTTRATNSQNYLDAINAQ